MNNDDQSCSSSPEAPYPGDCEFTRELRNKAMARQNQQSPRGGYVWKNCLPRAARVKLLLLDVDGVLTDGSLLYGKNDDELKRFNVRDGFGLRLLQEIGIEVGIITARQSAAVSRRAAELSLSRLYQGARKKIEVLEEIVAESGFGLDEIAYIGDDWLDLKVLGRVGFAVTVADGAAEVKEIAHYVTRNCGGQGAVREVCDLILEAKGKYRQLLEKYL